MIAILGYVCLTLLVLAVLIGIAIMTAPEGWQDKDGFHFKDKKL